MEFVKCKGHAIIRYLTLTVLTQDKQTRIWCAIKETQRKVIEVFLIIIVSIKKKSVASQR